MFRIVQVKKDIARSMGLLHMKLLKPHDSMQVKMQ